MKRGAYRKNVPAIVTSTQTIATSAQNIATTKNTDVVTQRNETEVSSKTPPVYVLKNRLLLNLIGQLTQMPPCEQQSPSSLHIGSIHYHYPTLSPSFQVLLEPPQPSETLDLFKNPKIKAADEKKSVLPLISENLHEKNGSVNASSSSPIILLVESKKRSAKNQETPGVSFGSGEENVKKSKLFFTSDEKSMDSTAGILIDNQSAAKPAPLSNIIRGLDQKHVTWNMDAQTINNDDKALQNMKITKTTMEMVDANEKEAWMREMESQKTTLEQELIQVKQQLGWEQVRQQSVQKDVQTEREQMQKDKKQIQAEVAQLHQALADESGRLQRLEQELVSQQQQTQAMLREQEEKISASVYQLALVEAENQRLLASFSASTAPTTKEKADSSDVTTTSSTKKYTTCMDYLMAYQHEKQQEKQHISVVDESMRKIIERLCLDITFYDYGERFDPTLVKRESCLSFVRSENSSSSSSLSSTTTTMNFCDSDMHTNDNTDAAGNNHSCSGNFKDGNHSQVPAEPWKRQCIGADGYLNILQQHVFFPTLLSHCLPRYFTHSRFLFISGEEGSGRAYCTKQFCRARRIGFVHVQNQVRRSGLIRDLVQFAKYIGPTLLFFDSVDSLITKVHSQNGLSAAADAFVGELEYVLGGWSAALQPKNSRAWNGLLSPSDLVWFCFSVNQTTLMSTQNLYPGITTLLQNGQISVIIPPLPSDIRSIVKLFFYQQHVDLTGSSNNFTQPPEGLMQEAEQNFTVPTTVREVLLWLERKLEDLVMPLVRNEECLADILHNVRRYNMNEPEVRSIVLAPLHPTRVLYPNYSSQTETTTIDAVSSSSSLSTVSGTTSNTTTALNKDVVSRFSVQPPLSQQQHNFGSGAQKNFPVMHAETMQKKQAKISSSQNYNSGFYDEKSRLFGVHRTPNVMGRQKSSPKKTGLAPVQQHSSYQITNSDDWHNSTNTSGDRMEEGTIIGSPSHQQQFLHGNSHSFGNTISMGSSPPLSQFALQHPNSLSSPSMDFTNLGSTHAYDSSQINYQDFDSNFGEDELGNTEDYQD